MSHKGKAVAIVNAGARHMEECAEINRQSDDGFVRAILTMHAKVRLLDHIRRIGETPAARFNDDGTVIPQPLPEGARVITIYGCDPDKLFDGESVIQQIEDHLNATNAP